MQMKVNIQPKLHFPYPLLKKLILEKKTPLSDDDAKKAAEEHLAGGLTFESALPLALAGAGDCYASCVRVAHNLVELGYEKNSLFLVTGKTGYDDHVCILVKAEPLFLFFECGVDKIAQDGFIIAWSPKRLECVFGTHSAATDCLFERENSNWHIKSLIAGQYQMQVHSNGKNFYEGEPLSAPIRTSLLQSFSDFRVDLNGVAHKPFTKSDLWTNELQQYHTKQKQPYYHLRFTSISHQEQEVKDSKAATLKKEIDDLVTKFLLSWGMSSDDVAMALNTKVQALKPVSN